MKKLWKESNSFFCLLVKAVDFSKNAIKVGALNGISGRNSAGKGKNCRPKITIAYNSKCK